MDAGRRDAVRADTGLKCGVQLQNRATNGGGGAETKHQNINYNKHLSRADEWIVLRGID